MTFTPSPNDAEPVDIGHGHTMTLRYRLLTHRDMTVEPPTEYTTRHLVGLHDDHGCGIAGWIPFANADEPFGTTAHPEHHWQVEDWNPETFTVSPSLLCRHCGDHGFIRNGRWEPA